MQKLLKKYYNPDPKLAKLLKGKRIAYVCPGAHLKGMRNGDYIDNYDIVCRVQIANNMPENTWKDYGKRTDILATAASLRYIKLVEKELYKGTDFYNKLKYIIIPRHNQEWGENYYPGYGTDEYLDSLLESQIPIHCFTKKYLDYITSQFFGGHNPYSGVCGIIMLLNYDIKELYVTGMNFYRHFERKPSDSPTYTIEETYFEGHIAYNTMPNGMPLTIGHNATPQIEFLRKLKNGCEVIKFDDYLQARL